MHCNVVVRGLSGGMNVITSVLINQGTIEDLQEPFGFEKAFREEIIRRGISLRAVSFWGL